MGPYRSRSMYVYRMCTYLNIHGPIHAHNVNACVYECICVQMFDVNMHLPYIWLCFGAMSNTTMRGNLPMTDHCELYSRDEML